MPTKKTMDDLAAAALELNQKTDQLNAVIDDFEESLEKLNVGVSVWVDIITGDGSKADWQLGYEKIEGAWRVAVRRVDDGKAQKPERLGNVSRLMRLEAVARFELLAIHLTSRLVAFAQSIERGKR